MWEKDFSFTKKLSSELWDHAILHLTSLALFLTLKEDVIEI